MSTPNIILVLKVEFPRVPGTGGPGCYRKYFFIAAKNIITIFVSMKSVLINLSLDIYTTILVNY